MESSRDMNTVVGTGTSGNRSAARAKAANAPRCRQARAVRHCVGTFNVRNHRFTVQFGTALVHSTYGITASQWTCRARARDAGKANSYQYLEL